MSAKERPRVLVISEIRLYRDGLAHFLEQDERLIVYDVCHDTDQALDAAERQTIDAVLLDTGMPGALEFVQHIGGSSPATKVIALGLNEIEDEVLPFVESGVAGYVCRDGAVDDVVQAVLCALNQELICSRQIASALQRRIARLASGEPLRDSIPILTQREKEIAQFLHDGLSNKEIAARLSITISTVKNHVHSILEKLRARSRSEAAARCRELGLSRSWKSLGTVKSGTRSVLI